MDLDLLVDRVEQGDHAAISAALRTDPSLAHACTEDGDTLLHIACWQKQAAIVRELLAYAPDVDARGHLDRTPLHYAVHDGDLASVPIVAALLARGADPTLADARGATVAELARIEMISGLDEVLALLSAAPSRSAADSALDVAATRDTLEPTIGEAAFRIGGAARYLAVRAYRGRDNAGHYATALCVDEVGPRADGGTIARSCYPKLGVRELRQFAAALATLPGDATGVAVLDIREAGLRVEVASTGTSFRARGGDVTVDLDAAALAALVADVEALCMALDAWHAADVAAKQFEPR